MDEYEEIPWSTLLTEDRQGRAKTLYFAAALIAAVIVGFVGVRWLTNPGHGEPQALAAPLDTTTSTALPAEPEPEPVTTSVLSEADLQAVQAVEPVVAELAAIARAEWFVTDYFTVDGPMPEELFTAFVGDAVLPEMPILQDTGITYVEWARAFDVRATPNGYGVSVVFRSLTEEADGTFVRSPVRAVEILVAVQEGETAVAELPVPILPPVYHRVDGWMETMGDADEKAIAATLDYAGMFDDTVEIVESGVAGPEWRVVFTIGDRSGNRWPVVMRSDTIPGS
ncbi:MAG: hypothetical protein ABFR89_06055 [Actinomycetota bacterium]